MFRKTDNDYFNKCGLLSGGFKLFVGALLAFFMVACDDDDKAPEPDPEPTKTFKLHIGEENVVPMDFGAPDYYPPMYKAVLVMEDLPADENIIYVGGVYSTVNPEPDISDCTLIYDCSGDELFQDWDWDKEPLYLNCMLLFHPVPATTYYVRGYVLTDKGEYYSNTIEIRSNFTAPIADNHDAYEIPVIFHLFPDAEGNYPVKDWMVSEQIDYANHVYGNYYKIPGQTETGVRFVAATHAPDGTPLETPGIFHETEAAEIDIKNLEFDDKYVWDMEQVLNVWVCPIKNGDDLVNEYSALGGFSFYPFFDADEKLEGCNDISEDNMGAGIFLNSLILPVANSCITFAHEAGHSLGLDHIFAPDDFCADTPWYDYEAHWLSTQGDVYLKRTSGTGEEFWSDNIMDYEYGFMTGLTLDQLRRIRYTLQHAYYIPGEAGKEMPAVRSTGKPRRFTAKPVH